MPVVEKNIIKEWFKNLKKPDQDQFWTWLDSFYHKLEGIAIEGITGLQAALNKKADLVNGVVPESQLPFTINTNEVINIGLIEVTANNVKINIHESGSNKVRISGQIIERSFVNNLPFTAVSQGNKFLRIVAKNEPGLFFLKQSVESDEPQEPTLDLGELHVRLILITPDGAFIDQEMINGFKLKSEDNWKTVFPNKLGVYSIPYTDDRTCFSLETTNPSNTTKSLQIIEFGAEISRDITFTIKNNTLGSVVIQNVLTDGLYKGFADNTPFTVPSLGTLFAKYNHIRNVVEILKVGSDSINPVTTGADLTGNGTASSVLNLSVAKNAEIAGKTTMAAVTTYVAGLNLATASSVADKLDRVTSTAQSVASSVTFAGNITAAKFILTTQASNTTVAAIWSDGGNVFYNGIGGTPKKIAYDVDKMNIPSANGTFAIQKSGSDISFIPTFSTLENLFFEQNGKWAFPNIAATTYSTLRTGNITQTGQAVRNSSYFVPVIDYIFTNTTAVAFRRGSPFIFTYGKSFKFIQQFDINSSVATTRLVVGLSNMFGTAAPTNVSADTLIRTIGVCKIASGSNLSWIWNDATGSANVEDMGSGFPANDFNSIYRLTIDSATSGASVSMKLDRINKTTGIVISITKVITSDFNIPDNIYPVLYCCDSVGTGTGLIGDYGIIGYINLV